MIHTVTLNTGYDDIFIVDALQWGEVTKVSGFHSQPAGKGVNLARRVRELGLDVTAYGLVGEQDMADFGRRLDEIGVTPELVSIPGGTRHNLTLLKEGGGDLSAHMVGRGFTLRDPAPVQSLMTRVRHAVKAGDVVTLNGSLPNGLGSDVWAQFIGQLRDSGATLVLDAQGKALVQALDTGGVYAAKPNEDECCALPGVPEEAAPVERAAVALTVLRDLGVEVPMVTLGERGVAHLVEGQAVLSVCPVESPVVTVGAGDSFLAGFCVAVAEDRNADSVAMGLATATAHVAGPSRKSLLRSAVHENMARIRTSNLASSAD